jgi:hypothetical protein
MQLMRVNTIFATSEQINIPKESSSPNKVNKIGQFFRTRTKN